MKDGMTQVQNKIVIQVYLENDLLFENVSDELYLCSTCMPQTCETLEKECYCSTKASLKLIYEWILFKTVIHTTQRRHLVVSHSEGMLIIIFLVKNLQGTFSRIVNCILCEIMGQEVYLQFLKGANLGFMSGEIILLCKTPLCIRTMNMPIVFLVLLRQ